uniref:MFS domain-containing protein n=1 Tax=Ascaris lumbricoides TaxID=6252 RepID=A0A0M3ITU2_ASCLU
MLGVASLPAIVQVIGFIYLPESPRFLFYNGRKNEAINVVQRVYSGNKEWIDYEMSEIKNAHKEEMEAKAKVGGNKEWIDYEMSEIKNAHKEEMEAKAKVGDSFVLWRMVTTPHVLKALTIGCLIQLFQQLAGVNTIMYYTGHIIQSAGIKDKHITIWISLGISSVP